MTYRTLVTYLALALTPATFNSRAFAEDAFVTVPPVVTLHPAPLAAPEGAIDILGIVPGMPRDTVKQLVVKQVGDLDLQETTQTLGAGRDGVKVSTVPYVGTLVAQSPSTSPIVTKFIAGFGGPASGNQLIGILRVVSYPSGSNRPLVADMVAQLIKKYGQPTIRDIGDNMQWQHKGGHIMSSGFPDLVDRNIRGDNIGYALANPPREDVLVSVILRRDEKDRGVLAGFMIETGAGTLRRNIAQAEGAAIQTALKKRLAEPHGGAVPTL